MKHWPHAPSRQVTGPGCYCVTASTLHKVRLFDTPEKLSLLENALLSALQDYGWQIQAWAVFTNHYHFVGVAPEAGADFPRMLGKLHKETASALNQIDGQLGRRVWFNYRDTELTYEKSHLARLAYVINNPVKHGLVSNAENYEWCSASWFRERADRSFYETVLSFKTDRVNVEDDF